MKRKLGCLSGYGILSSLAVLVFTGAYTLLNGWTLFSPGALSAAYGDQPLRGVYSHAEITDCAACHPAFWTADRMADRCMDCHFDIAQQVYQDEGLHGALKPAGVMDCRVCHPEHRGAGAPMTVLYPSPFPHETLGFSLAAHAQTAQGSPFRCEDCHTAGLHTFSPAECQACHQELDPLYMQAHLAAFDAACLACHDGADRFSGFDHSQTSFPLEGGHALPACEACHSQARSAEDLAGTPAACFECHAEDDAHAGAFGQDCALCHTPQNWEAASFDHSQTSFPLTGLHLPLSCASCHQPGAVLEPGVRCFACHAEDDAHAGAFGQDCAACHTPLGWDQASFDHTLTGFPLSGAHQEAACLDCHAGPGFASLSTACSACHQKDDAHQGSFGQDCAACHSTSAWEPASFDHSRTGFALTGAHVSVSCQNCHTGGVYRGTPSTCSACHGEPAFHRGLFSSDCASCHSTSAWSPARFDLAHTFPFNHGRSSSGCDTCHPSALTAYTCYGCHEHTPAEIEKEHREEGISDFQDCMRCHPDGREPDDD